METIKSTLKTEAIFSDDKQHRYLLKKTWNSEKQSITIITMYPHYDGILNIDLTTQLIMNKVFRNGCIWFNQFCEIYTLILQPLSISNI